MPQFFFRPRLQKLEESIEFRFLSAVLVGNETDAKAYGLRCAKEGIPGIPKPRLQRCFHPPRLDRSCGGNAEGRMG
jgi:hypothetical protein